MKRFFCVLAATCALSPAVIGSAFAGNGGKGSQTLTAACTTSGMVTVHASSGASAWVNNSHYLVLKLTGTVTPVGGTAHTFTKVYGRKQGFHSAAVQTCTGSQTSPMGTFGFTVWVVKTPAQ
jgi:hypothetical protein